MPRRLTAALAREPHRLSLLAAVAVLFVLAVAPFIILGDRSWVTIHDTMDGMLAWYVVTARAGASFIFRGDSVLPSIMNGLPRAWMTSQINLVTLWFVLLPPFWAFVLNSVVVRAVAFVGSYALLARVSGESAREKMILPWVALLFALLPFYTLLGLTAAGIPLIVHAYLNVEAGRARWHDWLALSVFPFYSSLYLMGVFVVAALGLRILYLLVRGRPWPLRGVPVFLLLIAAYAFTEWPTISAVFIEHAPPSHRVANNPLAFEQSGSTLMLRSFARLLAHGQTHAPTVHVWPIMLGLVIGLRHLLKSERRRLIAVLLTAIVVVSAFGGYYPLLVEHVGPRMPVLLHFHFDRLYFFLPLMWFVLFAIVLSQLIRIPRLALAVPFLLLFQMLSIARSNKEVAYNVFKLMGDRRFHPSFGEFHDEDLFGQVKSHIGKHPSSYRVAAVGLHPSVLQYNGFYTLDSYQTMYSLAYKLAFRKIIEGELAKDKALRTYFDAWGSRCYVFSAELGTEFLWRKDRPRVVEDLAIDVEQFRLMGGDYLVSSVPIIRIGDEPARLVRTFETPRSYWRIYLYDVTAAGSGAAG